MLPRYLLHNGANVMTMPARRAKQGAVVRLLRRAWRKLAEVAGRRRLSRADYAALEALKCRVAYNRYGGYCVPQSSRHRPAARRILAGQVHEPETIEFMVAHRGAGDIVHAGTYFGDFLPALARASDGAARVWAFEPNPENYRCARITLELNAIGNVELVNAGLGARKAVLSMRTTDRDGSALGGASHILTGPDAGEPDCQQVSIVTVDEVVPQDREVSIIQLDVEGHELEALAGALMTIRRCRPVIILEVWPGSNLTEGEWFRRNILDLGYSKSAELHRNAVFICRSGKGPTP